MAPPRRPFLERPLASLLFGLPAFRVALALSVVACSLNLVACETARARPSEDGVGSRVAARETARARSAEDGVGSRGAAREQASRGAGSNKAFVARAAGCPDEMARVDGYCIDRYEAHLEVRGVHSWLPHSPYERVRATQHYVARSSAGVIPQGYISRNEARLACERADKRLCAATEWYSACHGQKRHRFPYGDRFERRRCNSGKVHLLSRLFGENPRAWSYEYHFNSPKLNQQPGFLGKTGEYADCVGDTGTYDMVGNLHEWVSDDVSVALGRRIPIVPKLRATLRRHSGNGVFAGGFYGTLFEHGEGCAFVTLAHEPTYHDYSTGFRCCKDATDR